MTEEGSDTENIDKHKEEQDDPCDSSGLPSSQEANILRTETEQSESALPDSHSDTLHHLVPSPEEHNNNRLQDVTMAKTDEDKPAYACSATTLRTIETEEQNGGLCGSKMEVSLSETLSSPINACDSLLGVVGDSEKTDGVIAGVIEEGVRSSGFHDSHRSLPSLPMEQPWKTKQLLEGSQKHKRSATESLSQSSSKPSKKKSRKKSNEDSTSGRWTAEEHREFLKGLHLHGREWKKVATLIPTRSSAQVRSHAQKYFVRLQRMQEEDQEHQREGKSEGSFEECGSTTSSNLQRSIRVEDVSISSMPLSVRLQAERILSQPETVQAEVNLTLERLRERYRQLQEQLRRRQQSAGQSNETPAVEDSHDNESTGGASIESLHHEELIALHVLQGGLASTNESDNDLDSDVMVSTTKMNDSVDPKCRR